MRCSQCLNTLSNRSDEYYQIRRHIPHHLRPNNANSHHYTTIILLCRACYLTYDLDKWAYKYAED